MRVEFNQGVPPECIDWLWKNVGKGNIEPKTAFPLRTFATCDSDSWFFERVFIPKSGTFCGEGRSVPTITVKDSKLATLFALRWS